MRIAICDDSQREQEQFIKALHGWDPTRQPECFMTGVSLLEADWNWPDATGRKHWKYSSFNTIGLVRRWRMPYVHVGILMRTVTY